ncbi:MAG: OprD family outer membrane porin [Gammaproteobacteria bacterium]
MRKLARQGIYWVGILIGSYLFLSGLQTAYADQPEPPPSSLPPWISVFEGDLRLFDYQRLNDGNVDNPHAKSALAALAKLYVQSRSQYGFSFGLGLYAVSDFGLSPALPQRDTSIMGSSNSFATPGQAFLQYQRFGVNIRAGNILLDNPWVNGSALIMPASYQGIRLLATPLNNLTLEAAYWGRWRPRNSSDYTTTNLYDVQVPGAWDTGIHYNKSLSNGHLDLQYWYYGFTSIAGMSYTQGLYRIDTRSGWNPYVGAQYAHETDQGSSILGPVEARVYGALLGVQKGEGSYSIAYNKIPERSGAFQNGNIVSPYTGPYNNTPLYTASMLHGLIDQSTTGSAWKVAAAYWLGVDRAWRLKGSYAYYRQDQFLHPGQTGNPRELNADATYFIRTGPLRGLSIRDRFGVFSYPGAPKAFFDNRIQIQYAF